MSNYVLLLCLFFVLPTALQAQQKRSKQPTKKITNIPMTDHRWEFQDGKVDFVKHKDVSAIKILEGGGLVTVRNLNFSNGTIEFDAEPIDAAAAPFVSVYFRHRDKNESECFYLRVGREQNLKRNDAVQYAPFIKGVNIWDMLPHYQGPAHLNNNDWNHIKLVISGMQMRAYVNNVLQPTLQIPYLEGNSKEGSIAFEGFAIFANLVVTPDAVEDLSSAAGVDLTAHDANYIRHWLVTQPAPLVAGRELTSSDFPTASNKWDSLFTERNGLINLTRKFGVENRRYVWLKTTLRSTTAQQRRIDLGFSDEVWVFVNGKITYVDKNLYLQGMRKDPNGRCSIHNSSFEINLKSGENELLIGVANDFYGWGIISRLDNLEGIELMAKK
jgi:hypothetical protein